MQFRDLKAQYQALKPEIDKGIQDVLDSAGFILGKPVAELETQLAAYTGRKHCVTCASGTDALQLALMAMDVGSGDAVFTSDFTYFASAGTASILGAEAVLVDIDTRTFNLSPDALEAAVQRVLAEGRLTPKVIVPVDLFGLPADYERILPIAGKYGLKVLEDGAQGFGGSMNSKRVCSFGDMSATSFFPAKPLGCFGDGGAVFLDDDTLDQRLRSLRVQGKSPEDKYDNREIGINSRLDTIQAAILLPKLKAFAAYELDAVNHVADRYTELLAGTVVTPYVPPGFRSSWAQYTIMLADNAERTRVQAALQKHGIPSMIYYPRGLHQQKAYSGLHLPDAWYPNTLHAVQTVLSLPLHPYLTDAEIDRISGIIIETIRG